MQTSALRVLAAHLAALALLPIGPTYAQGALFLGPEGGIGAVAVVVAGVPQPVPSLVGVRLEPLDFCGRTPLETFLPNRPRHHTDIPGAARLSLPGGQGNVYRFSRADGSGGGFFLVPSSGQPVLLLEQPQAGGQHPFLATVGYSSDGLALLAASTPGAGGDLFEIDLTNGTVSPRTQALAPQVFSGEGLLLGAGFGAASTPQGVLRFARVPGAQASLVPFEGAPLHQASPLVLSADGSVAAAIAGSAPTATRVFTFGAQGVALAAHPQELNIGGAGFAQQTWFGPYFALSDDGSHVAFTEETPLSREIFLARSNLGQPGAELSSDANYLDTLDEIGLVRFVPGGDRLLYAVGTKAAPEIGQPGLGFERVDFYTAELPAGSNIPVFQNLSLSSGDAVAPFTTPSLLDPDTGVYLLPGGQELIFQDTKTDRLLRVAASGTAAINLASEIKSLDGAEWTGSRLALSLRVEPQQGLRRQQLASAAATGPLLIHADLPDGTEFKRLTAAPNGRLALEVAFHFDQWLASIDLSTNNAQLALPFPVPLAPVMAFDPAGNLRTSLGNTFWPGLHFQWQPSGALAFETYANGPSFVLP
jgi:hypothetical protein